MIIINKVINLFYVKIKLNISRMWGKNMKYKKYVGESLISELGFGGWLLGNTSKGEKMTDEVGVKCYRFRY